MGDEYLKGIMNRDVPEWARDKDSLSPLAQEPDSTRERLARLIADALGYEWTGPRAIYENKPEYIKDRGGRGHDVNTPYKADFLSAADALIAAGVAYRGDVIEECAKVAEAEPVPELSELPPEMTHSEGVSARAAIRATKKCIASALRSKSNG